MKCFTIVLDKMNRRPYLVAIEKTPRGSLRLYYKRFPMKLCTRFVRLINRGTVYKEVFLAMSGIITGLGLAATGGSLAAFVSSAAWPLLIFTGVMYGIVHVAQPDMDEEKAHELHPVEKLESKSMFERYTHKFVDKVVELNPFMDKSEQNELTEFQQSAARNKHTQARTELFLKKALNYKIRSSSRRSSSKNDAKHAAQLTMRTNRVVNRQLNSRSSSDADEKAPAFDHALHLLTSWDGRFDINDYELRSSQTTPELIGGGDSQRSASVTQQPSTKLSLSRAMKNTEGLDKEFIVQTNNGSFNLGTYVGWSFTWDAKYEPKVNI